MDILGSIPLAVLFGTALLLARAWMVTDAGRLAIARLARLAGPTASHVLFGYTLAVAGLSLVIPNFVAALAATPFIGRLVEGFRLSGDARRGVATAFAAACMWAANVGGKGSLVGSPSNALLVAYLQTADVPGREVVNYLSWLVFGVPMALVLALTVWVLLRTGFAGALTHAAPNNEVLRDTGASPATLAVWRLTYVFLGYWMLASVAQGLFGRHAEWPLAAGALGFGAWLSIRLFRNGGADGGPLLRPGDMRAGFPWRGFLLIGITAGASFALVKLFAVDEVAADFARSLSDAGVSGFLLLFTILLLVILTTEIASNTVVAFTFFPVAHAVAPVLGLSPISFLILVSVASTAGYMTPMATPANALVVGEVRGIQYGRLVLLGFLLDLLVAAILALWGAVVMPLIL
jgi:sodium-dependent dicarboxylate transporter 2/3/5